MPYFCCLNLSTIGRKYYKWNDSESDFSIKLGMDKSELLTANIIREVIINEELQYQGSHGCPWRVHFKDDKLEQIWFNSDCIVFLKGFNISEKPKEPAIEFLNSHFELIPELNNKEINLKEYEESDVLLLIYTDSWLRLLAVIRKNKDFQI